MNLKTLGTDVDATAVAAQTAVDLANTTPWSNGFTAIGVILFSNTVAGAAGVAKIQTSPDNSTFTDAVANAAGVKASKYGEVTLARYVRLNVTVAWTAGTVSAYLLI